MPKRRNWKRAAAQRGNVKAVREVSEKEIAPRKSDERLEPAKVETGFKKMKKKLTKEDIQAPASFRPVSHVGWEPEAAQQEVYADLSPNLMSMDLLESVDMDIPNSYIDMDMSAAMSAKEESEEEEEEMGFGLFDDDYEQVSRGPPQPPPRAVPPQPPVKRGPPPPPPPARISAMAAGAPPPPAMTAAMPPPPPPSRSLPFKAKGAPTPPIFQRAAAPPPPRGGAPPPPPALSKAKGVPPPFSKAMGAPPPPPPTAYSFSPSILPQALQREPPAPKLQLVQPMAMFAAPPPQHAMAQQMMAEAVFQAYESRPASMMIAGAVTGGIPPPPPPTSARFRRLPQIQSYEFGAVESDLSAHALKAQSSKKVVHGRAAPVPPPPSLPPAPIAPPAPPMHMQPSPPPPPPGKAPTPPPPPKGIGYAARSSAVDRPPPQPPVRKPLPRMQGVMVGMGQSDTRADETSAVDDAWQDLYEKVEESFNGGGGGRYESKKLAEAKDGKKAPAESWEIPIGAKEQRKAKGMPIPKARFSMAYSEKAEFEKEGIAEKTAGEAWEIPTRGVDDKHKKKAVPMAKVRMSKEIAEKAEKKEKESKYKKEDFLRKESEVSWRVEGEARRMRGGSPKMASSDRKAEWEEKRKEMEDKLEKLNSMRSERERLMGEPCQTSRLARMELEKQRQGQVQLPRRIMKELEPLLPNAGEIIHKPEAPYMAISAPKTLDEYGIGTRIPSILQGKPSLSVDNLKQLMELQNKAIGSWKMTPDLEILLGIDFSLCRQLLIGAGLNSLGTKVLEQVFLQVSTLIVLFCILKTVRPELFPMDFSNARAKFAAVFEGLTSVQKLETSQMPQLSLVEPCLVAMTFCGNQDREYPLIYSTLELGHSWEEVVATMLGMHEPQGSLKTLEKTEAWSLWEKHSFSSIQKEMLQSL